VPDHDPVTGEVLDEPPDDFLALRDTMRRISSAPELLDWARANAARMNQLPIERLNDLRGFYSGRMAQLRQPQTEAAE
jgi:hypothetical protein